MAHSEAYHTYIPKLVKCLPMDDAYFMAMLSHVQRLAGAIKFEIDQKKSHVSGTSIIICSTYIHVIMYL